METVAQPNEARSDAPESETVFLHFRCTREVRKALRRLAVERDMTLAEILSDAAQQYLKSAA